MLVVSRANAMHFVKVDNLLQNAENTLSANERYAGFLTRGYAQKWNNDSVVKVQCVSDSATVPTIQVYGPGPITSPSASLVASYPATSVLDARYYFEFTIDFASYQNKTLQVKITQGTDVWMSEYQQSYNLTEDLDDGEMVLIEYTNKDNPAVLPNVQIDYTTGIEFFFYVEAILKDIGYSGEDKMFTNISEKVLIESQTFKTRRLATIPLPEFMTDKIAIAGKAFTFLINDLVYSTEGLPEVATVGANLRALTWEVTHTDILGFTTDDRQIQTPAMDGFLTRVNNNLVSTWTFVIPADYLMLAVVAGHAAGSAGAYNLTVGLTLHGTDYINAEPVPLQILNTTFNLTTQPYFATDTTIYVEISGAGAIGNIAVLLLRNTA